MMDLPNNRKPWTDEQLKLAFYLYCQLPFGKLHSKNPKVIQMAKIIGKTPNALAMKLVNLASLDPVIRDSGRKGLGNASFSDRKIWDEFHNDWERLVADCNQLLQENMDTEFQTAIDETEIFTGETRETVVSTRIGQNFFRRSVLSSYESKCCISGVSLSQLLIASHIIPWSVSKENRLNPSNGLCLSAIHDRAFDKGFITVSPDYTVMVSERLKEKADSNRQTLLLIDSDRCKINLPRRFMPNRDFLEWHNQNIFMR